MYSFVCCSLLLLASELNANVLQRYGEELHTIRQPPDFRTAPLLKLFKHLCSLYCCALFFCMCGTSSVAKSHRPCGSSCEGCCALTTCSGEGKYLEFAPYQCTLQLRASAALLQGDGLSCIVYPTLPVGLHYGGLGPGCLLHSERY